MCICVCVGWEGVWLLLSDWHVFNANCLSGLSPLPPLWYWSQKLYPKGSFSLNRAVQIRNDFFLYFSVRLLTTLQPHLICFHMFPFTYYLFILRYLLLTYLLTTANLTFLPITVAHPCSWGVEIGQISTFRLYGIVHLLGMNKLPGMPNVFTPFNGGWNVDNITISMQRVSDRIS